MSLHGLFRAVLHYLLAVCTQLFLYNMLVFVTNIKVVVSKILYIVPVDGL